MWGIDLNRSVDVGYILSGFLFVIFVNGVVCFGSLFFLTRIPFFDMVFAVDALVLFEVDQVVPGSVQCG